MKKREAFWYAGPFILFFIPYLLTIAVNGIEAAVLNRTPDPEEYLPILLSRQIAQDYEEEAIKAQAVITRTNFFRRLKEGNPAEILQMEEIQPESLYFLWKTSDNVYQKAVQETEGQILTAEGEMKLVPYHEISGGQTRDGTEAFHSEEYAYLKSVDSSIDKDSAFYLNSTYIAEQQMPEELTIREREKSGYVSSLTANGEFLEGESFSRGMGMTSSNFTIQKIGREFRFLSRGKGHGLGYSQNGGNEMAKKGSTWKEILEVYFPAMELAFYEG